MPAGTSKPAVSGKGVGLPWPIDVTQTLYDALRRHAAIIMSRHAKGDIIFQPTSILNEVMIELSKQNQTEFQNRAHVVAVAARMIRRQLNDETKKKRALKRGRDFQRVTLTGLEESGSFPKADVLDLDKALREFARHYPKQAQVIELRFYGGSTIEEISQILGIHERTVGRYLEFALTWLRDFLSERDDSTDTDEP